MKGLAIIAILLVAISGGTYYLLKPSDMDLRRLEDETAELIDRAETRLVETTRILNPLRSIKPNILALDRDLNSLRKEVTRQKSEIERSRGDRPNPGDHRGSFIEKRKELRKSAEMLEQSCQSLLDRVTLISEFMHNTQPKVKLMLASFGDLYQQRLALSSSEGGLPDELRVKIDYLQTDVQRKQSLAKSVFETGTRNAEQGRVLMDTVDRELDLVIEEIAAVRAQLGGS